MDDEKKSVNRKGLTAAQVEELEKRERERQDQLQDEMGDTY